ncbi:MAG TPA: transcriptional regulator [Desulfosporosinus sp.]|nr:transcriptional regulator [Desulfosporosinus sp.]
MDQKNVRFGDFIKSKRLDLEITLRDMCERIGFSPAYLSDIENNRRYPMDNDKLELLIKELKLSADNQETLYDLAGKERKGAVSPDLPEYIMDSEVAPYVRMALRTAKQNDVTVDEWKRIIEELGRKDKV